MSTTWKRLPNGALVERAGYVDFTVKARCKDLREGFGFRVKADVDDAVSEVGAGGGQYGGIVSPDYQGIIQPPSRPLLVASLFQNLPTNSNIIRNVRTKPETTDDTGVQAEGAAYGGVATQATTDDFKLRDVVNSVPVTEDFLTDVGPAAAWLVSRLGYLVRKAEEDQLVGGDGAGLNMLGLLHAANSDGSEVATTYTQGSEPVDKAVANIAMATYAASGLIPEFAVVSPATYFVHTTERSSAGAGQYLNGPSGLVSTVLWGLRVVVSAAVDDSTVIIGSSQAGTVWRHSSGMRVESSSGYASYFGEGMLLARGKQRSVISFERPSGIGVLTLPSPSELES